MDASGPVGFSPDMPLHQFVLDTVHWTGQIYRSSADTQRWKVGGIVASTVIDNVIRQRAKTSNKKRRRKTLTANKDGELPPSVRRRLCEVLNATESATWMANLPCLRAVEDAECQAPMWASVLSSLKDDSCCTNVPISLSYHDDRMLTYGRDVPLCAMGDQCAALVYPANQGPLPIYVMPSVQAMLDRGERPSAPFSPGAHCLLCIRRDVHAAVLAWSSMVVNASVQLKRGACVPPPFANLVDVPGGYKKSAMINTENQSVFGPSNIVGAHASLKCRIDPASRTWYFDQSAIKHENRHSFLFQGTTAISQPLATDCRAYGQSTSTNLDTLPCTAHI